ncbi:MAG: putative transcriptional regulator, family [Actinomycetia bacterium]|nr:putative transcriptional regulator, family [Actinomycetes bacterium]
MAELNRLRSASGLSRAQVAERIGSTDTTIWRYETGLTMPRPSDVGALLEAYGVSGAARDDLIQLAKDARKRGWWHRHRETLKPGFDSYIGLESEASVVRTYQSQVVPGLLQTERYARAIIEATGMTSSAAEISEKVSVRMARQELIARSEDPVRLVAVLDEAVVRRQVGGPEVMAEQLSKLIDLGKLPNVEIRVMPFGSGAHAAMDGPFYFLEFPESDDPDLVYLEQAGSGLIPEDVEELRRYTLMFGNLMATALTPSQSSAFIAKIVKEDR